MLQVRQLTDSSVILTQNRMMYKQYTKNPAQTIKLIPKPYWCQKYQFVFFPIRVLEFRRHNSSPR